MAKAKQSKTAKPQETTKLARLAKMGDVVRLTNPDRVEALRGADIILHVADGTDVVVDPDSEITIVILPEPEIPQAKSSK